MNIDDGIVWADPPQLVRGGGGNGARQRFVAVLKQRPGQWALYPNPVSSNNVTWAWRTAFPGVDASARKRPDGKYDIYVRWVGES